MLKYWAKIRELGGPLGGDDDVRSADLQSVNRVCGKGNNKKGRLRIPVRDAFIQ